MNIFKQIDKIVEPRGESTASRIYDYIMLVAIIIGITPLMFRTQHKIFLYFDIIAGVCFIIDYILRWMTYYLHSSKSKLASFFIYPFTPMAIVDLLSILPIVNLLAPSFRLFRVPRLMSVMRVIKIIRYYEPLGIVLSVVRKQMKLLWTVLSLALTYVFITALIMFNCEEEIDPETGKFLFDDFFDAFYWAACTLTTVGYGDLYPISDTGRIISIFSAMVGIAIIALPSGIITAGYMDEINLRKERKEAEKKEKESQSSATMQEGETTE